MANYFRITAYNPAEDICVIMDSNGLFEQIYITTTNAGAITKAFAKNGLSANSLLKMKLSPP